MLKIENSEVMGWEHAIRGMRNPLNSWAKSDSVMANIMTSTAIMDRGMVMMDLVGVNCLLAITITSS